MLCKSLLGLMLLCAAGVAQTITLVSGDGQLTPANISAGSTPIVFHVSNGSQPAVNQTVLFSIQTFSPLLHLNQPSTVTDANGNASVIFVPGTLDPNISFTTYTFSARTNSSSVTFHATSYFESSNLASYVSPVMTAPIPNLQLGDVFSTVATQAGQAFSFHIAALYGFQAGQPVNNVGIRVKLIPTGAIAPPGTLTQSVTCQGSVAAEGAIFTDSSGNATCTPIFAYPNSVLKPQYDNLQFEVTVGDWFTYGPFNYKVSPAPLIISGGPHNFVFVPGIGQSTQLVAAGGVAPYTFSLAPTSTPLPGGITLAANGTITNSGAAPGLYPFTPELTDSSGQKIIAATGQYSVAVSGGTLAVTPSANWNTLVGKLYAQHLAITGGVPPYTISVTGALPAGVTGFADPGGLGFTITGTPTLPNSFALTITVVDAVGFGTAFPATLNVYAPLSIISPALQLATVGSSFALNLSTQIIGGAAPFGITVANLPTGLVVNSSGAIVGAPTVPGLYKPTINAIDSLGQTATSVLTLAVSGGPLVAVPPASPSGIVGVPYNTPINVSGGVPPYFYVPISGDAAVTISPAGLLTATFKTPGTQTIGVNVTDQIGSSVKDVFSLPVQVGTPAIGSITNGATFATGAIAPGEIISIFGTSLGTVAGDGTTLDATGKIVTNTTPGGTSVMIGPYPAPILYANATQINAVVPYGLTPGDASVQVKVTFNGTTSAPLNVAVSASSPGLFTITPTTQAAVLNQDNTLNGIANPAPKGSTVQFYVTGGGTLATALLDGHLATAADLVANASLTIDGLPAIVQYAGVAPGFIGLLQINAVVPAGAHSGVPVLAVLTIGTANSQAQTATLVIQ